MLKDDTHVAYVGLSYPPKTDIIFVTSGDATAVISVEALGNLT